MQATQKHEARLAGIITKVCLTKFKLATAVERQRETEAKRKIGKEDQERQQEEEQEEVEEVRWSWC